MSAQDLEQRARELLAQQFDLDGEGGRAASVRRGCFDLEGEYASSTALRAIAAALRQQPAPVDLEQPGTRKWMAEVCRAAAASLEAHGVLNEQLPKVADWIGHQPAPVVDDARMARALEAARCSLAPEYVSAIEEAIAAYDPSCGARTVRVVDDELPGMWSQSDFMGGAADAADDARQLVPSVDDAMVDRYLAAQAKAVQEIDDAWGNGGKAASYLHPVREACRAGLTAALARAQEVQP